MVDLHLLIDLVSFLDIFYNSRVRQKCLHYLLIIYLFNLKFIIILCKFRQMKFKSNISASLLYFIQNNVCIIYAEF